MRKHICLFTAFIMLLSLTSCDNTENSNSANSSNAINTSAVLSSNEDVNNTSSSIKIGTIPYTKELVEKINDDFYKNQKSATLTNTKNELETIELIKNDEIDVGIIIKPWKDEAFDDLIDYHLIGYEAPVFVTSEKNETSSLTTEDVISIYTKNKAVNWSDFGGNDGNVLIAGTRDDIFGMRLLENTILHNQTLAYTEITNEEYDKIYEYYDELRPNLASYSKSSNYVLHCTPFYAHTFGSRIYDDYGEHEKIKAIKLDGQVPSDENIRSGKYPSIRAYVVSKKGVKKDEVDELVNLFYKNSGLAQFLYGVGSNEEVEKDFLQTVWGSSIFD